MTYDEAREALEIPKGETYADHQQRLEKARQELLESVRKAPRKERSDWESDLVLFDKALNIVATYQEPKKLNFKKLIAIVVAVATVLGAGLLWKNIEEDKKRAIEIQAKIDALRPDFESAISERKWADANQVLDNIEELDNDSEIVAAGRKQIEEGLAEERRQQMAFYVGKIKASLEADDWETAEKAIDSLAEFDPTNEELSVFRKEVALRRKKAEVMRLSDAIQKHLRAKQWQEADLVINQLFELDPRNSVIKEFRDQKKKGEAQERKNKQLSLELVGKAAKLDKGVYSREAIDLLREALRLNPANSKAKTLYEKMSTYTRTMRVPEDYKTLSEALQDAGSESQIILGEGRFKGTFRIPPGVEIVGQGQKKTVLYRDAKDGSVVELLESGETAVLSKLSIEHESRDYSRERHALIHVSKGSLKLNDCDVREGSGHGIYVTNGASIDVRSSKVQKNGWNGVAVVGEGSKAFLQASLFFRNLQNGAEAWNGGALVIDHCRMEKNSRCGISSSSKGKELTVTESVSNENREVGVYASNGVIAKIVDNEFNYNAVAGVFIRANGTQMILTGNKAIRNSDVGIVLEQGVIAKESHSNVANGNRNRDIYKDAVLPD